MTIARSTELEAVNTMLSAINRKPTATLVDLKGDPLTALTVLREVSRSVQSEGWSFNREHRVTLTPDPTTQEITVSDATFHVDVVKNTRSDIDVQQRGGRLYDRKNRTYAFTKSVEVELAYFLDWDELPEPARNYIALKAARRLIQRVLGEGAYQSNTMSIRDEEEARDSLASWDSSAKDHSFWNAHSTARHLQRKGRAPWLV